VDCIVLNYTFPVAAVRHPGTAAAAAHAAAAAGGEAAHRDPVGDTLPLTCTAIWQEFDEGTSSHSTIRCDVQLDAHQRHGNRVEVSKLHSTVARAAPGLLLML
jgi:hypothetical protein